MAITLDNINYSVLDLETGVITQAEIDGELGLIFVPGYAGFNPASLIELLVAKDKALLNFHTTAKALVDTAITVNRKEQVINKGDEFTLAFSYTAELFVIVDGVVGKLVNTYDVINFSLEKVPFFRRIAADMLFLVNTGYSQAGVVHGAGEGLEFITTASDAHHSFERNYEELERHYLEGHPFDRNQNAFVTTLGLLLGMKDSDPSLTEFQIHGTSDYTYQVVNISTEEYLFQFKVGKQMLMFRGADGKDLYTADLNRLELKEEEDEYSVYRLFHKNLGKKLRKEILWYLSLTTGKTPDISEVVYDFHESFDDIKHLVTPKSVVSLEMIRTVKGLKKWSNIKAALKGNSLFISSGDDLVVQARLDDDGVVRELSHITMSGEVQSLEEITGNQELTNQLLLHTPLALMPTGNRYSLFNNHINVNK